ncbi:hypothetical protein [Noviherbaspirillum autotrophicum]|uniref:Uncharacterized protein n=1 Tax=Noviherbaspirillum autotrophicum TaxID=709839 RepID=A0A0C1YLQ1_9BURK|nr:hypothetical protein [Noviherbaspirillum autotrophicum]KIF81417.1 hypothetical protein TSA66_12310 [Noviherbaspirillum autotrophicum]
MTTLTIKDLALASDLDRKEMAAVRGGTGKSMYQYCGPNSGGSYGDSPFGDIMKNSFSFDASQSLGQVQNTQVNNGNNVAFASGITANVNPTQTGSNNINFGH